MADPIIPVNRYSKWATVEKNKDLQMSQAWQYAEFALAANWPNTMPTFGSSTGFFYESGVLKFKGDVYSALTWENKVLSFQQLDQFFKDCVANYHNIYNS